MSRIIGGLIIAIVGILITWKSNGMLRIFGRIRWAERNLGFEGGSRLFYQLLGFLIVLIGFAIMTNLLGGILLRVLGPLFDTIT